MDVRSLGGTRPIQTAGLDLTQAHALERTFIRQLRGARLAVAQYSRISSPLRRRNWRKTAISSIWRQLRLIKIGCSHPANMRTAASRLGRLLICVRHLSRRHPPRSWHLQRAIGGPAANVDAPIRVLSALANGDHLKRGSDRAGDLYAASEPCLALLRRLSEPAQQRGAVDLG